jgi:pantoate--beta-alanine ligase
MPGPAVIRTISEMQKWTDDLRVGERRIGLVPTMGFLHAGHATLIQQAARLTSEVVVSLFVNPTQFGPTEDFEAYPRDFESDFDLIAAAGGSLVFAPTRDEMYPEGFATRVTVGMLSEHLCGASRPGHFEGMATIVAKLLSTVRPHFAIFGQKDAQQLGVIRRMVRDLNLDVEIVGAPTVREADGLAKSSRNSYMDAQEREEAAVIFQALQRARDLVLAGETETRNVLRAMDKLLQNKPKAEVEYIAAVDPVDFQPVQTLSGRVLIATAVRFGKARLIDNLMVNGPENSGGHNSV